MRAVPLFRYHLEPLNCLLVPDDIVQNFGAVTFDPGPHASSVVGTKREGNLHTMVARKGCLVRLSQPGLRLKPLVARKNKFKYRIRWPNIASCKARLHAFWTDKCPGEITESV